MKENYESRLKEYRVWDEETKKYYAVLNWEFGEEDILTIQSNPIKTITGVKPDRFIRKLDRFGIRMFSGDIVKIAWEDDMEEYPDHSEYGEIFGFDIIGEDGEVSVEDSSYDEDYMRIIDLDNFVFQVVGTEKEDDLKSMK